MEGNTLAAQAVSPRFRNYTKTKMIDIRSKISEAVKYIKFIFSIGRKVAKVGYNHEITVGGVRGKFTAAHFEALKADVFRILNKELVDLVRKFKSTRSGASRLNNGFKMPIVVAKGLQDFFGAADANGSLGTPLFEAGKSFGENVTFIHEAGNKDGKPAITSSAQVTALFALYIFYAQLARRSSVNRNLKPEDSSFKGDHYGQDENMKTTLSTLYPNVSEAIKAKYDSDLKEFRDVARLNGFGSNKDAFIKFANKLGVLGVLTGQDKNTNMVQYTRFFKGKGPNKGKILGQSVEVSMDTVRTEQLGDTIYVFMKDVSKLMQFDPSDFRFARIQTINSKARILKDIVLKSDAYASVKGIVYPANYSDTVKTQWEKYSKALQQDVSAELTRVAAVNKSYDDTWLATDRKGDIASTFYDQERKILAKLSAALTGDGIAKIENNRLVGTTPTNEIIVKSLMTRYLLESGQSVISRTLQLTKLYRDKGVNPDNTKMGIDGTLAKARKMRISQRT